MLTGIDVLLHLQMFKRGGIDEVCSLLVLVAQEQADQQANQPTTDGPDQATTDAELQIQHVDNNVDTDKTSGEGTFGLCARALMQDSAGSAQCRYTSERLFMVLQFKISPHRLNPATMLCMKPYIAKKKPVDRA